MHLCADIIEHVDDLLIVFLPRFLLILEPCRQLVQLLSEVRGLDHRLELAESEADLLLDLVPLRLVVEQQDLNLLDQLLLGAVDVLLLHLERPLDVVQQHLSVFEVGL